MSQPPSIPSSQKDEADRQSAAPMAFQSDNSDEPTIHEFFDLSVFVDPFDAVIDEPVAQALIQDYRERVARGEYHQITPGLVAPSRESPGKFDIADFRHRLEAARRLGLPVRAEVRKEPFKPGEINLIRMSSLRQRKKPGLFEMLAIIEDTEREMGFATAEEAAAYLGMPASTLSSISSTRRIPEDLRPHLFGVGPRLTFVVARLRDRTEQEQALKIINATPRPTVVQAELLIERQIKSRKKVGRPSSTIDVTTAPGNIIKKMALIHNADPATFARQLHVLGNLVDKHVADGMKVIIALIEGRKPPEPPSASPQA